MRDPAALRRRADAHGDSDSDQYFLDDPRVLRRMVDAAAAIDKGLSHVYEIGPGAGALTARLLAAGESVTVVEADAELVAFLREEFEAALTEGRLSIIEGDAMVVDVPAFTSSVSNLPYSISSQLLFRLLPLGRPMVVLVQREFAERAVADPGTDEYGRLSVSVGYYGEPTILETVPPEAFYPEPPVESAMLQIIPREPAYSVMDETLFLDLVTAVFTQRRKTLRNAIRNTAHISGLSNPERVIAELDEDLLDRRAGTISPAEYAQLTTIALKHDDD